MRFLLRGVFWMAVVAAFAPAGLVSTDNFTPPENISNLIAQADRMNQVCSDLPELCELAGQAGSVAGDLTAESLVRVEAWLQEQQAAATSSR